MKFIYFFWFLSTRMIHCILRPENVIQDFFISCFNSDIKTSKIYRHNFDKHIWFKI